MMTATELRKKITARPRLKMDDVVDFYEDLQEWLINAAEKDYTWTNVFFSCPKSNFNSMEYAVLNSEKLSKLGWIPMYDFDSALKNNIIISKGMRGK